MALLSARLNIGRLNAERLHWIGADTVAPTPPQALTVVSTIAHRVSLSWTASTDYYGVARYYVERCTGPGCTDFVAIDVAVATAYVDPSVSPLTTYRYRVRAIDASGNYSGYSNIVAATTPDLAAPQNLTVSATTVYRVTLAWQAPSDGLAVRYRVERCTGPGCTTFGPIGTSTTLSYIDNAVNPLTTYRYRVRAEDADGHISAATSNIVAATTPDRADLTNVWIKVGSNWVKVNQYARVAGATVTQALNEVVDTASITFDGKIPYALARVEISINDQADHVMFAGHITAVRTIYEGRAKNVAYECDCCDYTWLLNSHKVTVRYTNANVSAIIATLAGFAPAGFTYFLAGITNDPVLDEITFTNEELAQAISRTCERAGLYWYVDYIKVIRAFNSSAIPSAGTIDDTHPRTAVKLAKHDDGAAIATRVIARGGGAGAASDAAPGQTTLPIVDPAWYDPAWYAPAPGVVECGPQRITYTGVVGAAETGSTIGKIATPSASAMLYAPGQAGTGSLSAGVYWCAVSSVTNEGETETTAPVQVTVPANGNIMFDTVQANRPTDPKIKGFYGYVSLSNSGQETMVRLNFSPELVPWTTDYVIYTTGTQRTTTPRPTASSAGVSSTTIPAGSTTLQVDDLAPFPAAGWAEAPGGQLIRYTGKSAASGPGTLTGIPASGIGSITAAINSGTIRSIPHLTGIPASGAGSIVYPIKTGDEVLIVVIRDDAAAQAALAAATGGDGIREEFLTDGRLAVRELTARGDALLAMRNYALVTFTCETRDPAVVVGTTITVNTTKPPIVGTFLIQRVTISQFQARGSIGHPDPLRVVEASSRRYTFDDLVQQIKLLGRIN